MIDIDKGELDKYEARGMPIDLAGNFEITEFMESLIKKNPGTGNISRWNDRAREWREKYPICPEEYKKQPDLVNPYFLMDVLSKESSEGDII